MKKKSGLAFVQDEYGTHPRLPELVLCPPEFEFKTGHTMAKRFYIGHCIDISRKEPAFPWDRLKENANTLIYCSLGTHVALYRTAYRFFNALMKTAAMRPEYVFVVSVGPGRNNGDFGSLPDNVIVAQRVPQLAILQKTSVMLTNGGLGTVKECIYHAVPMLVYPCGWDQPGNAARVRYHRIGICDTIKKVTYRRMSDKIDELINSSEIRENIQRMSRLIRKNEKLHEGLRFILDHGKKLNACSRSEIRTSTGSMPTENLTVFS